MTQKFESYQHFLNREDKSVNGYSEGFEVGDDIGNYGCWNCRGCSRCSDCSRCSGCSDCSGCSRCSGCGGLVEKLQIPIIENIHQKILEAVSNTWSFDMSCWHGKSQCGTTHCRAGFVVNLAESEGYNLESKTSTEFAAMMILKASSPIRVYPPRFFESNEIAMKDIIRCAELEKQQTSND